MVWLELFSVDGEFVDGPEEVVSAGLGDADELGIGGIEVDRGERFVAIAFGEGAAPFFAVFRDVDFILPRVVTSGTPGIEGDGADFGKLGKFDLNPHSGFHGGTGGVTGFWVAIDASIKVTTIVAGGEFPGFTVGENGRRERLKFALGPRLFTGRMLLAQGGYGVWLGQSVFVSEGIAHEGGDVGDPLVVVGGHGDHESLVFLSVNVAGESVEEGSNGGLVVSGEAGIVEEGGREEVSFLSRHGSAFPVTPVAGEAELLVDDFSIFHGLSEGLAEAFLGPGVGAGGDSGTPEILDGIDGFVVRIFVDKAVDEGGKNRVLRVANADGVDCLKGHLDIFGDILRITEGFDHPGIAIGEEWLGDTHGGGADKGGAVIECSNENFLGDLAHSFECPEGVKAIEFVAAGNDEVFEFGNDGFTVLAEDDELLSGVTPPAVGVLQVTEQLNGWFVKHVRRLPW